MGNIQTLFHNRKNILIIRTLLIFGFIAAVSAYAWSYSSGINGRTGTSNGCNCHGSSPNTATSVSIASETGSFSVETGSTTNFTVTVSNSSLSRAGVNIAVKTTESGETNVGSLSPASGSGLQTSSNELVQSTPKNLSGGSAAFQFSWTAPTTPGTYYIRAVGNAVNANGSADANDRWNFMTVQQITVTSSASLALTAPTASSVGCPGSVLNVTWTASGVTNVKIELSSDGGSSYPTVLAASVPASPASYAWNIPAGQTPGNQYRIRVSDAATPSRNSASPNFSVSAPVAITAQPQDVSTCTGSQVSFSVTATGSGLTYQWKKNGTNINNGTNATYTIQSVTKDDEGFYECVVAGGCGNPVTSNQVALSADIAPKILQQPTDQESCAGGTVSFTVEAEATGINYQWQKDGQVIPNATAKTLTIENVTGEHAGTYKVVVNGSCNSPVTSNPVGLTISSPPSIAQQPVAVTACQGSSATFSVKATGSGLLYQWRKNGNGLPNTNSPNLIITNLNGSHEGRYDVIITGKCQPSVTSEQAQLSILASPFITQQPSSQTVTEGSNIDFTVVATGSNISYKWFKDNVELNGKTTADLHLENVKMSDAGNYVCKVYNDCSEVSSQAATLTVNTAGPGPVLTLKHVSVDFGIVPVSTQSDTVFASFLKNTGTEKLTITGAEITGVNSTDFVISGWTFPIELDVNAEFDMTILFKPMTAGTKTAQVNFTTNAASNPVLNLSGIGGEAKVTVSKNVVEFKSSGVGEPVEMTVDFENEGNMPANVVLEISSNDDNVFSIETSPTFVIQPNDGESVLLKFTPKSTLEAEAKLKVRVNGSDDDLEIELSGMVLSSSVDDLSGIEFGGFTVYPNPATSEIRLDFRLPEPKNINASVVDIRGNVVKSFGSEIYPAGQNSIVWNGKNSSGENTASGEYMLVVRIGKNVFSFPVMLSK